MLVAALTVDSVGNGLFAPLSLVYFVRLTDVPLALVGVLLTVANLVALPLPVWAGTLADRFGPRYLVVAAEAAMALGFLAFAVVTGPVGILLAATLLAAGVRVFWCTIFTLVADYADGRPGGAGVDSWYAIAFRTVKPPDPALVGAIRIQRTLLGHSVKVSVATSEALPPGSGAELQLGVMCSQ